jgi:hypothetical protein
MLYRNATPTLIMQNSKLLIGILFMLLAMVTACKKDNNTTETDKIKLPDVVTYSEHIAPIIYENCTPCHRSNLQVLLI